MPGKHAVHLLRIHGRKSPARLLKTQRPLFVSSGHECGMFWTGPSPVTEALTDGQTAVFGPGGVASLGPLSLETSCLGRSLVTQPELLPVSEFPGAAWALLFLRVPCSLPCTSLPGGGHLLCLF